MTITYINPDSLYDGSNLGMSQAVLDGNTSLLFISGQVDWDKQMNVVGRTMKEQMENALRNLQSVLGEANVDVANLLRMKIYVRGEVGEYMGVIQPILKTFLGETSVALTGIGVASLASPETLVEIEAIAHRP